MNGKAPIQIQTLVLAFFYWLSWKAIPYEYSEFRLGIYALWIATALCTLSYVGNLLGALFRQRVRREARKVQGTKGTARKATKKELREAGLDKRKQGRYYGFFIGMVAGTAIWIQIQSSGLVLSPAGGGKTVSFVIPALLHADMSMLVTDLKGTLATVTKAAREKKLGHKVICLNPGGLYGDRLGPSGRYNPLQPLIDLWADERLHGQIMNGTREVAQQLLPEPSNPGENGFFRSGSRKLIVFACIHLLNRDGAVTLTGMLMLLSDPVELEAALHIARASTVLKDDLARMAADLLAKEDRGDLKQIESFREGALQVLEPFAPSGILADITATSDFTFADLRREKITVYLMADPTQQQACASWIGLLVWAAKTELIRQPRGHQVCLMLDEATNFKVEGLPSLLTTAREFGMIIWLIVQELEQFNAVYGEKSVETLMSQTEAKLIYGSRSQSTCRLVSDMLGEASINVTSYGLGANPGDPVNRQVSEVGRKILDPYEVARLKGIIAFVDGVHPFLTEQVGYHEISPMRNWADINPLFGKPYRGKVKLRL